MSKASETPLQKVTLNLYEGDKDTLASFYSIMGWSVAAREIINRHCLKLREVDSQEVISKIEEIKVDLNSLPRESKKDGDN